MKIFDIYEIISYQYSTLGHFGFVENLVSVIIVTAAQAAVGKIIHQLVYFLLLIALQGTYLVVSCSHDICSLADRSLYAYFELFYLLSWQHLSL